MRSSLELWEIESILEDHFDEHTVKHLMTKMESEANTCLCYTHCYSECLCGAWEPEDDVDLGDNYE